MLDEMRLFVSEKCSCSCPASVSTKIPDDKFLERKVIGDRIHGDFLCSYQIHMEFFLEDTRPGLELYLKCTLPQNGK